LESKVEDVNADLMEKLGLAEGVFDERVALITGSARGIGEATARALAFLGAKIIIVDRLVEQGRAVETSIQKAGGQARFLSCDLSKVSEISRLIPRAQAVFGPVDLLINSAVHVSVAPMVAYDLKEWEYTFAVNARAPFMIIKALLPDMIAKGVGTLVNVVAYEGSPLAAIYSASKSATRSMARSVAQEVPPGVPVYAFSYVPGIVDTPLIRDVLVPQMSRVMGAPVDALLAGLVQNPGYPGLMPLDHCATALVYCLAHAKEYNAQVADPFDPLQRFGVIDVPKLEAGNLRAMDVAGAISQDIKYYLRGLTDLNHDLEKRIEVRTNELELERARSESLLLNILPREIAQTLKERPGTIAQRFDQTSVLFADMVGFTPLSAEMTPEEMVELLNAIYSFYDSLTEKYGLEKIRTIGDNYMVASGVPRPRHDHAQALACMALEMCDIFKDEGRLAIDGLNFRIGINSGPLVAGVIGYKKFQYDIWGPTVNTASRMESQGLPGKVQITQATYELLKDEFVCEPRGTLEVKGVGEVETWLLVGRGRDEVCRAAV
jgi:class 3 adenylate cyclase/NAD(P)-dependent dehydrogenase (short-subunit alcohol dehydrogenase family)